MPQGTAAGEGSTMTTPSGARSALCLVLLSSVAMPAFAQDAPAEPAPAPATGDAPPPVATEAATPQGGRTYTPADFARFAPRNALDMLNNVRYGGFFVVIRNVHWLQALTAPTIIVCAGPSRMSERKSTA